jgi:hypothetical protein
METTQDSQREDRAGKPFGGSACSAWLPIETAPRDGTPFVWMHYITILHTDRPYEYEPHFEVLRRAWINEEKVGRKGDGFWMGKYTSIGDARVSHGYWMPMPPLPNAAITGREATQSKI